MLRVGARNRDIVRATKLSDSVVSRIRRGVTQNPNWEVVRRIEEWARYEARRHKLPKREWLDCFRVQS